jgi:hypothetical protein
VSDDTTSSLIGTPVREGSIPHLVLLARNGEFVIQFRFFCNSAQPLAPGSIESPLIGRRATLPIVNTGVFRGIKSTFHFELLVRSELLSSSDFTAFLLNR